MRRLSFALILLLTACSKPAQNRYALVQPPRTLSSLSGMVAGFLPARVVVCNPAIPYVGPVHDDVKDGINPLMMPFWLPDKGDGLDLQKGEWIQFDLKIDWSQLRPLQIANLARLDRRDKPSGCADLRN